MNVCLVAHFAYGALSGGAHGHIGGVEWQTSLLAKWLATQGHHVSLVTWDEGQPEDTCVEGVRLIKLCRQNDGLRGIRFFHPRWTSLIRALHTANADIYYQNCAEYVTGQVALWCRLHKRKFVYSVASDPDCAPDLPEIKAIRERVLYRYGLKSADRLIVQTHKQQEMLLRGFKRESTVLPMPCPGPSPEEFIEPQPFTGGNLRVVWVGRIAEVKRLEVLLEVAAGMPEIEFEVAGEFKNASVYTRRLKKIAYGLSNLKLLGRVDRNDMPRIYQNAFALCCTSTHEGFPNTFIEAWSYGVPVISTVDPDNLIHSSELGLIANDASSIILGIRELAADSDRWHKFSKRARLYYLDNHLYDNAMARFEAFFIELLCLDQRLEGR
jgi:glycosyltransferase involved in cell wall biosynthesis